VNTVPPGTEGQAAPDGYIMVRAFSRRGQSSDGAPLSINAIVTSAGPETRASARRAVVEGAEALQLPGVTVTVAYDEFRIAGVTNDTALVSAGNASIESVLGPNSVLPVQGVPPAFSEDFGSFQALTPGVMYFLGVSNPATGTVGMPHDDDYVADDGAILVGARAMAAVILDRLLTD
jgi:metal-dependent amidase/aminoacylase/carboxypeptidase family protein